MSRIARYRACPLCEAICGLEFQYEDDRLVAIRGDAADPFSQGHICPKGNAILDLENDPDRVRVPLLREGDGWREIGWDEALERAGAGFAAIQRDHGAAALGVYLGNPNVHHLGHFAYLPSLLKLLRTPNVYSASSVDQWPHQLVAAQMFGHQFLLPVVDIDHTDFLLMLGANPVASMGSLMTAPGIVRRLKQLTARGRLVVVDPRRSETAELASEHVFIRPGTDALFLIGLLRALLARGPARIERYAGKLNGLSTALDAVAGFDMDAIAGRCGIERATIERIAAELHTAPRAAVYGRTGVSIQSFGTLAQWLIQLLNLVTGNLDAAGGVLPNDAAIPLTGPGTSSGQRARWASRVRGLPEFGGELPVAALCEEIVTPGDGQIRALLTVAGNPVLSTPHGKALEAALPGLDFQVAIDIYVNETTRSADLILPPASSLSQPHYDLFFNALAVRRVARWSAPLRDMEEHERADWRLIDGLARTYAAASGRDYAPMPPPNVIVAGGLKRGNSGLDFSTVRDAAHGIDLGPLRPCLLDRLQTASRAIECAPALFLDDLQRLRESLHRAHAHDALQLIGRRDIRSNNSWMHNAARLVKGKARHHLWMHPDDLAARGLADGTRVRLRSRVGSIDVEVQAHDGMMRGVVCLPHGFGHARDGVRLERARRVTGESYNDLSDPLALDAPSGNAALNGLEVWVEAAA
ncbi:MAG: molybdopterin-binding oxidoreductase [Rhodanobacteraceae bacterium]